MDVEADHPPEAGIAKGSQPTLTDLVTLCRELPMTPSLHRGLCAEFPIHFARPAWRRFHFFLTLAGTSAAAAVSWSQPLTSAPRIFLLNNEAASVNAANLSAPRAYHTAVLLGNGNVLVAGGSHVIGPAVASAELYHAATGQWSATGSLNAKRDSPRAILLPNGLVLVAGGMDDDPLDSAELYDPSLGTWTPTGAMTTGRYGHTITLLTDGKVLVTGGQVNNGYLNTAEIYDPMTATWTPTGSLSAPRYHHTATRLTNGKVLVAGGGTSSGPLNGAELYDPATGTWATTGSLAVASRFHTATLLSNDRVLVAGGQGSNVYFSRTEIYDPTTGIWTPGGDLALARSNHTATRLDNGIVLVQGGTAGYSQIFDSSELYDPLTGIWMTAGNLGAGRNRHSATVLPNGSILFAGGTSSSSNNYLNSTEIYHPFKTVNSFAEGIALTQSGYFFDIQGNSTVTLSASSGSIVTNHGPGTWTWTGPAGDGPAYKTVSLTARDTSGAVTSLTFGIHLTNEAPVAAVTLPQNVHAGQTRNFTFTAADPSPADQSAGFLWTIDFGDDSVPIQTPAGTASPLVLNHTYANGGTYAVRATAVDKDGALGAAAGVPLYVSGPTALQVWRLLNFPAGGGEDLSDADHDGLVNLIEFAFGLDPNSGASLQLPSARLEGNQLVVTFDQPAGIGGSITYGAEWSPSLKPDSWTAIPDSGSGHTHTFSVPREGQQKMYIRLTVTRR
jgi:hypothetical protein